MWESITSQQVDRSVDALQRQVSHLDIEFRFPFLDRDLVEFVLKIPFGAWPSPNTYSRLHRDAMRDVLPTMVSRRYGKAEFTPALMNRVIRAGSLIERLLLEGDWASGKYVDRAMAREFWRTTAKRRDHREWSRWRQVWAIATLEAWLRTIFGYDKHPLGGLTNARGQSG